MAVERRRRAVLVGTGTARLLALATELEARGLEVVLHSELAQGLEECTIGACDVLVAVGGLAPEKGSVVQDVAVPVVLLDSPDAPDLPLRCTGLRTVLSATVAPSTAAERVCALLGRAIAQALPSPHGHPEQAPGTSLTARPHVVTPGSRRGRMLLRVLVAVLGLALGLTLGLLFLKWFG